MDIDEDNPMHNARREVDNLFFIFIIRFCKK